MLDREVEMRMDFINVLDEFKAVLYKLLSVISVVPFLLLSYTQSSYSMSAFVPFPIKDPLASLISAFILLILALYISL